MKRYVTIAWAEQVTIIEDEKGNLFLYNEAQSEIDALKKQLAITELALIYMANSFDKKHTVKQQISRAYSKAAAEIEKEEKQG